MSKNLELANPQKAVVSTPPIFSTFDCFVEQSPSYGSYYQLSPLTDAFIRSVCPTYKCVIVPMTNNAVFIAGLENHKIEFSPLLRDIISLKSPTYHRLRDEVVVTQSAPLPSICSGSLEKRMKRFLNYDLFNKMYGSNLEVWRRKVILDPNFYLGEFFDACCALPHAAHGLVRLPSGIVVTSNRGIEWSWSLFLRLVVSYKRKRPSPSSRMRRRRRINLMKLSPFDARGFIRQSGMTAYDADCDTSGDDEKSQRRETILKKLALTRGPKNPEACIIYLRRKNLIATFRSSCENPSIREDFLSKCIEPCWRTEIRKCIHHRVDVTHDKHVKQSGTSFVTGVLSGAAITAGVVSAFFLRREMRLRKEAIRLSLLSVATNGKDTASRTGLMVMRFIITISQVYNSFSSSRVQDKLAAIMQLVILGGELYVMDLISPLIEDLQRMAQTITLQAGGIMRTPLLKSLVDILSKVVSSSFFAGAPDAIRFSFGAAQKVFMSCVEGSDLFSCLMDSFKIIIDNVSAFMISFDLVDLFGKDRESALLAELDAIEEEILAPRRNKLLATDNPRIMIFRSRVEEIRSMHLGDRGLQSPIFTSKLAIVRELILMFLRNSKAQRREPMGIILAGDPGTGKTTFTESISSMVRARHDIPSQMDICWTYQPTKHQTIPSVVLVVQINDAFQMKDEIEPMLPLLQSLVDKTIVKAEGASLRDKEFSAVEPEVVVVSTNAEKYIFTTVAGGVSKLIRRYFLVRMGWTAAAKELAVKGNYDVSKTWEQPSNSGKEGLVSYCFGEAHTDKNTIFFDQSHMVRAISFSSLDDLTLHIYKIYSNKMLAPVHSAGTEKCSHGVTSVFRCLANPCDGHQKPQPIVPQAGDVSLPYSTSSCYARSKFFYCMPDIDFECPTRVVSYMHKNVIDSPGYHNSLETPTLNWLFRLDDNSSRCPVVGVPLGIYAVIVNAKDHSIHLVSSTSLLTYPIQLGSSAETFLYLHCKHDGSSGSPEGYFMFDKIIIEVAEQPKRILYKTELANVWSYEFASPFLIGGLITFFTAYMAYSATSNLYKWMYATPQGAVHGVVAGIPNIHNKAEVIFRRAVPWLGSVTSEKTLVGSTGIITEGKAWLHFAVYSPGVLVFPKHLITNTREDAILKLDFDDGFSMKEMFSRSKVFLCHVDLCFYFIGNIPGVYAGIGNCCSSSLDIPTEVQFRDHDKSVCASKTDANHIFTIGVETEVGDCGELYFSGNVVLGMHVGIFEISRMQVAVRVTTTMGDEAISHFRKKGFIMAPQCKEIPTSLVSMIKTTDQKLGRSDMFFLDAAATHQEAVLSGMVPIGCAKGVDSHKATCHRSTHYDMFKEFDPDCSPPNMGHAVKVGENYVSAITKRYHTVSHMGLYSMSLANEVICWYGDRFGVGQNKLDVKLSPLTLFTALVGHPLNSLIGAKACDKAVGFDLASMGLKKKEAFVLRDGEYHVHPLVLCEVAEWDRCIRNDIPKAMIVTANVKDEVLLTSQVQAGKARLFYVPPMALNMLAKMYFAPILAHLYARPELSGMFCAINPVSHDWDNLASLLLAKGKTIFEGDQSSFDNHHMFIFTLINLLMKRLMLRLGYSAEDTDFALKLLCRFREYYLVMQGGVYFCDDKMVSGIWMTLFINCLATIILTHMSVAKCAGRFLPDEIFVATVGDDLLASFTDKLRELVDPYEFCIHMDDMGYKFTPSSKEDLTMEYRTLDKASFLKRSFTFEDGRWKGRLAKSSLYKTLCYSLSNDDEVSRDRGAYLSVMHEAVLWGREFYNILHAKGVLLNYAPPTYDELHAKFMSGSYRTWDLENPVVELDTDYHVSKDVSSTKGQLSRKSFMDDNITHEGEEMVLHSGLQTSPTDTRTLDMSSGTRLETVPTSTVTTLKVVEEDVSYSGNPLRNIMPLNTFAPLSGFWGRNRRVGIYAISAATSTNFTFDPFAVYYSIPPVADLFNQYNGYRANYKLTFIYTGSTNSYGMVRVSASPPSFTDAYSVSVVDPPSGIAFQDFTMTSTRPHIDLNLSEACTCIMELPYPYANNFSRPTSAGWKITITELLPLANVNGLTPNDISLEVWMSLSDVHLFNITPQSGMEGSKPWSDRLARISRVAGALSGGVVTPITAALSASAIALREAGWMAVPEEPTSVIINRRNINTASNTAPDLAYHIISDEITQTNVAWDQFPLGREDDMDLVALRRRWGQIRNNWAPGFADPVECTPGLYTVTAPDFYLTPLAFFTVPFVYWTGDLDYKIEVFTSPLVRWRIGVAVTYPNTTFSPTSFPTGGDYITHEFEISGSTVMEFTVKYAGNQPVSPYIGTSGGSFGNPNITFYSLMTPTGPSATVPLPYVNLFVRAGENFQASVISTEIMTSYAPQSGGTPDVFGMPHVTNLKELLMTKVPHLRLGLQLSALPTVAGNFAVPADGFQRYEQITNIGPDAVKIVVENQGPTFRNWLGKAFIGYNGGTSITSVYTGAGIDESGGIYSVGPNLPGYGRDQMAKKFPLGILSLSCVTPVGVADLSYPSKNPSRFKTSRGVLSASTQICLNFRSNNPKTTTNTGFIIYCGGADDLVVGGFIGIPKCILF